MCEMNHMVPPGGQGTGTALNLPVSELGAAPRGIPGLPPCPLLPPGEELTVPGGGTLAPGTPGKPPRTGGSSLRPRSPSTGQPELFGLSYTRAP